MSKIIREAKKLAILQSAFHAMYYDPDAELNVCGITNNIVHLQDVRPLAIELRVVINKRRRKSAEYPIELSVELDGVKFISVHSEEELE